MKPSFVCGLQTPDWNMYRKTVFCSSSTTPTTTLTTTPVDTTSTLTTTLTTTATSTPTTTQTTTSVDTYGYYDDDADRRALTVAPTSRAPTAFRNVATSSPTVQATNQQVGMTSVATQRRQLYSHVTLHINSAIRSRMWIYPNTFLHTVLSQPLCRVCHLTATICITLS